jgi:acyl-CoA dehydrogenase
MQMISQANTKGQDSYFQQLATTKPVIDKEKDFKFWQEFVQVLDGAYVMNDSVIGV